MADPAKNDKITLVGGGLVGALEAIYLARQGLAVDVLERRPDMRVEKISAGRSINLAISTRGINALARLGLDKQVLDQAVPMKGRMMHAVSGELSFQPYGIDDSQYINSISRGTLNKLLMTMAEETGKVSFHFNQRCADYDLDRRELAVHDESTGKDSTWKAPVVFGTDGSASAVRAAMQKLPGYTCEQSILSSGYKELSILPAADGYKMEANALHIWPRSTFMLIALPNFERSFTCTLFLPHEGPESFARLKTEADVSEFFGKYFPDVVPLIDDLTGTFFRNPTGQMVTIKANKWNVGGQVALLGDAAHGIVPFYGQGMNCGFEDCTVLDGLMAADDQWRSGNWEPIFERFTQARVGNSNAIADMAVENFIEMRDKVGDPQFLLRKGVEKVLQTKFPGRYISRYAIVTFSNLPYKLALDAGVAQESLLAELCQNINRPEDVDLDKASALIDRQLKPLFEPYRKELAASVRS